MTKKEEAWLYRARWLYLNGYTEFLKPVTDLKDESDASTRKGAKP